MNIEEKVINDAYDSVMDSVWDSASYSVRFPVYHFMMGSVWNSVRDIMRSTIENSINDYEY